jgi:hypothetical protein
MSWLKRLWHLEVPLDFGLVGWIRKKRDDRQADLRKTREETRAMKDRTARITAQIQEENMKLLAELQEKTWSDRDGFHANPAFVDMIKQARDDMFTATVYVDDGRSRPISSSSAEASTLSGSSGGVSSSSAASCISSSSRSPHSRPKPPPIFRIREGGPVPANVIRINKVRIIPEMFNKKVISKVFVDGDLVSSVEGSSLKIEWEGEVADLTVSAGDVSCGDVRGNVKASAGNVKCGDVGGDVKSSAGNVNCEKVSGSVKATCGNVTVRH